MMPVESIICVLLLSALLFIGLAYGIFNIIDNPKEWMPWRNKEWWDNLPED